MGAPHLEQKPPEASTISDPHEEQKIFAGFAGSGSAIFFPVSFFLPTLVFSRTMNSIKMNTMRIMADWNPLNNPRS